jgi:hypothetical protein
MPLSYGSPCSQPIRAYTHEYPQARCCAYLAPDDLAARALIDTYGADPVVPSPLIASLPAPLAHIALGVKSHALDDAASVGPLNDERVWRWLIGPPYPHT